MAKPKKQRQVFLLCLRPSRVWSEFLSEVDVKLLKLNYTQITNAIQWKPQIFTENALKSGQLWLGYSLFSMKPDIGRFPPVWRLCTWSWLYRHQNVATTAHSTLTLGKLVQRTSVFQIPKMPKCFRLKASRFPFIRTKRPGPNQEYRPRSKRTEISALAVCCWEILANTHTS